MCNVLCNVELPTWLLLRTGHLCVAPVVLDLEAWLAETPPQMRWKWHKNNTTYMHQSWRNNKCALYVLECTSSASESGDFLLLPLRVFFWPGWGHWHRSFSPPVHPASVRTSAAETYTLSSEWTLNKRPQRY